MFRVPVPAAGLLSTRATPNGTVTRALVHEGDLVLQDQPLLDLSTDLDNELRMQRVCLDADLAQPSLGILRGQRAQGVEAML